MQVHNTVGFFVHGQLDPVNVLEYTDIRISAWVAIHSSAEWGSTDRVAVWVTHGVFGQEETFETDLFNYDATDLETCCSNWARSYEGSTTNAGGGTGVVLALMQAIEFHALNCAASHNFFLFYPGCVDEASWPNLDHDLVCGECRVLVNHMWTEYGGLCDNYCASIGKTCVGAWEENSDTCAVLNIGSCSTSFGTTSDAICECSRDDTSGDLSLSTRFLFAAVCVSSVCCMQVEITLLHRDRSCS